jgi:hypothetical protein
LLAITDGRSNTAEPHSPITQKALHARLVEAPRRIHASESPRPAPLRSRWRKNAPQTSLFFKISAGLGPGKGAGIDAVARILGATTAHGASQPRLAKPSETKTARQPNPSRMRPPPRFVDAQQKAQNKQRPHKSKRRRRARIRLRGVEDEVRRLMQLRQLRACRDQYN